jgi:hypothetical protein
MQFNPHPVFLMTLSMSIYVCVRMISQQIHCSDSLLISYSSYMFRRMYVIIREPTLMCPAELHYSAYGCIIYVSLYIQRL